MAAITGGGPGGVLRPVVRRVVFSNYTEDTLTCGHTVRDYDHRVPTRRRCVACVVPRADPALPDGRRGTLRLLP